MKKTLQSLFFLSIFGISAQLILTSSSNGRGFAANSGNTGAPSEGTTCRTCHGTGFGTTVSINVKDSNGNTVTSYVPGDVYTIDFAVNTTGSPSRYGFQMVSLGPSNVPVNGFSSPSANTRIVSLGNGRSYAEHRGKSLTNSFTTQWTAPAAGTGNVTFYGGGAAVNNNFSTSGDGGNTTTLLLTENTTVGISEAELLQQDIRVYPNPAVDHINITSNKEFATPTLSVFSTTGQLVMFRKNVKLAQGNVEKIDLNQLPKGNYILNLQEGDKRVNHRLILD